MRKIIYSVLHGTAAVFCIFLAAAAVCGCSGMNGAAGNMTGKEEKRLNEEMAEKMERRLPEEVKREQIGKDTAITAMDRFLAKFYVMSDDGTGAIVGEQFWPRAEIMEIAVDAWEKTSSPQYRDLMEQMYLGFVKDFGEDWSDNEYNDDIIWMTIACARACQAEENEVYKKQAVKHFNLVCDRAWSEDLGGGLFWRTDNKTKNSCINGPAAIAACILYQITGEQEYLEKAVRIYDWQCENLVGEDGAVYDAYDLENGINKWCSTYNQGTFIGAGLCLYRITGEEKYLENSVKAADYTMNVMYQGGVINTEDEGNDLPGFKGILARWLGKLVYEGGQTQYLDWMEKNAQTAWRNRNSSDIMWTRWADKTQDTFYTAWGCYAAVSQLWNCLPPSGYEENAVNP